MDIKLKTSEMLLTKLASGYGDAHLQAVAEIRLFAKWDDANRVCLARAGAIPRLFKLLGEHTELRLQESAMLALLNMSINAENKVSMVRDKGSLEAVMRLAREGESGDLKANAAALLCSLVVDDEARRIVSTHGISLWSTFLALLRDGSAKCKAEALKALFVAAGDNLTREKLLQDDLQAISLLIAMAKLGNEKLTEDCLAVLALLASCDTGAIAASTSIRILAYLVESGTSQRVQENAVSVLLNICKNHQEAPHLLPLQALIPALSNLHRGGSERGKVKAEDLLRLLGFDNPDSLPIDPNSISNHNMRPNTMPFFPPHPQQSSPPSSSHIAHFSEDSRPKPFSSNNFMSLARNLFTHKQRKKSPSTIP